MRNLTPLTAREARHIVDLVNKQYGCEASLDYYFIIHNRERSVYLVSRDVAAIELDELRINSLGTYFCEANDDTTEVRLSIDGSQMIGPLATQNVVTLNDEDYKLWAKGIEIPVSHYLKDALANTSGYILIKNSKNDFYGTAREKNNVLLNFVPKNRRIAKDA